MFLAYSRSDNGNGPQRRKTTQSVQQSQEQDTIPEDVSSPKDISWKRILLLIIAITIHNIPGKNYNCHAGMDPDMLKRMGVSQGSSEKVGY